MGQIMTWGEIRRAYPDKFVLLDRCEEVKTDANKYIVTKGEVVSSGDKGDAIYKEYCDKGKLPHMCFGHTNWDVLESEEVSFLGIRPANEH